jgi:internalin A
LLPERQAIQLELDEKWQPGQPCEVTTFEFSFLYPGLVRGVIARIGSLAGINALYWRDGLCLYEKTTRSHALIEQEKAGDWRGRIRLKTQGGQADELLRRLGSEILEEQTRQRLYADRIDRPPRNHAIRGLRHAGRERPKDEAQETKLNFGQPPTAQPQWYVSYAWGDDSPEGRKREELVDFLCTQAEGRGKLIQRDKDALVLGDSISRFMQAIGQSDRVFIVLSDKYLKSPYCMFELFEVWRNSGSDSEAFRQRTRVFSLPDAKISTAKDRIHYGRYWRQRHHELKPLLVKNIEVVGENDLREFRLMARFYHDVSDILATIADILQPRTLEELKTYGFNDVT